MTGGALPGLEDRPDPTAQDCADDAMEPLANGGRLRTYLGIAPGVGKTYAMLRDARAQRRSGVDAVVAYRERHGGQRPLLSWPISKYSLAARSPTGAAVLRSWTSTRS
jgi:hypothetical protein